MILFENDQRETTNQAASFAATQWRLCRRCCNYSYDVYNVILVPLILEEDEDHDEVSTMNKYSCVLYYEYEGCICVFY